MKKNILIFAIISFLIEIFVFNFNSFKTFNYKELNYNDEYVFNDIEYDSNLNEYYISGDNPYIELNVNTKINNIYLDIVKSGNKKIDVEIEYTDDLDSTFNKPTTNTNYTYTIVNKLENTKYINCHYVGTTYKIRLDIKENINIGFKINKISFNKSEPININPYRYLIILLLITFIYFSTKLDIFKNKYNKENKYQKIVYYSIIFIFIILVTVIYSHMARLNTTYPDIYTNNYVDALKLGHLYIGETNYDVNIIYDYSQIITNKITDYLMDSSYYNGKLYMYFGILPAIIILIFNLINISINTVDFTYILILLSIIFSVKLLKEIIYKYYPNTNFLTFILLNIFYLFNMKILLLLLSVRYYEMIVIMGYLLSILAIYFMIKATNNKLNYRYLLLSNIFVSLELLVRPNLILIYIITLYYLYNYIKQHKCDIKKVLLTFIPLLIIGLITCYLNYIRYNNIFEFGQNYQLTLTNNINRSISIPSIINGIYTYLFRVPIINTVFPFVTNNMSLIFYNLYYYNRSCGNGYIPMSILGILLLFIYKIRDKKKLNLILVFIITGLIILAIDSNFGGTLNRYSLEFTYLFIIPTILILLELINTKLIKFNYNKILLLIVLITCFLNLMVIFDYSNVDNQVDYNTFIDYIRLFFI